MDNNKKEWKESDERKELILALVEILRPLRANVGLRQEDVANAVGITRATYRTIECKEAVLNWKTFLALLFFFNQNPGAKKMIEDAGISSGVSTELAKQLKRENFRNFRQS